MDRLKSLSRKVAVVGVGTSAYGKFPDKDATALGVDAFLAALDDSGVSRDQIDGLVVHRAPHIQRMSEMLGLRTRYMSHPAGWGAQSGVEVIQAVAALEAGLANCIALIYADDGGSRNHVYGGPSFRKGPMQDPFEPWGYTAAVTRLAMLYRRYSHFYGTKPEQLAEIALTFRHHANLNPAAIMHSKTMTLDDYWAAPWIVEPLRRNDCCLVNDGAVCLILTRKDRAADAKKKPVYIAGFGEFEDFEEHDLLWGPDFGFSGTQRAAKQAYEMADVSHGDIDLLCAYDHFAPTIFFQLEGLGFCKQGEAPDFIAGGRIRVGGDLPINPHGGHLSESYLLGWTHHAECIRQLRGECGARQVKDAEIAQYSNPGVPMSTIIYSV
ncbi:thiolase family protein [Alsobacter sp. SYSU M60028]|uniref:Thiolase family protein n=1 Tax=Alsobacter ponti TaxID=2962936 RepID=A0ABT1L9W8_9HYPH|nr:thiolase family protein [Alsobacter ponti]MCP8937761.1 thiolase family protein [Alsobacter ponti]